MESFKKEEKDFNHFINKNGNLNQSNKKKNNIMKIKYKEFVYNDPSIYLYYWLLNLVSILLALLFQILLPKSRKAFKKSSYITGIPIIRNYYFLPPFILNILFDIISFYNYIKNHNIKYYFKSNFCYFLRETRCLFIFTNIIILIVFYIYYGFIYIPLKSSTGFKLSGHVLASIFSGAIIINLNCTLESFSSRGMKSKATIFIQLFNIFLYFHSIYTIFWTCYIYHKMSEILISYFTSCFTIGFLHFINFDELFICLFDNRIVENVQMLYD